MKKILFGAVSVLLMACSSGNDSSEKEREESNHTALEQAQHLPASDSLEHTEAIRQDHETAQATIEQQRLNTIRQDSLKIIDKFNEAKLKPSDVFIKMKGGDNTVKESKVMTKMLDSKGYKLLKKKLNFIVDTDWGGDMTASYWKYRLEIENPYSNKKYNCEVYIGVVYGNALEITFNDEKEAIDFLKNSSPYIQNKRGNTYALNDYEGMERKGKKIIVYKTAE